MEAQSAQDVESAPRAVVHDSWKVQRNVCKYVLSVMVTCYLEPPKRTTHNTE